MTNPTRRLPTGREALEELGGDDLAEFVDHADWMFGDWMGQCERHGTMYPFLRAALTGSSCEWWGAPSWPDRVAAMLAALDDPAHRHWGEGGKWYRRAPEPPGVADREGLRSKLLRRPWDLDEASAQWFTNHALGMVKLDYHG